jgi:hypothetical protein
VDAPLEREAADLVAHAGALADQARADPVQGQEIHLLGRFDRPQRLGGPLHRLGKGFSIPVVVLVPLEERLHVLSRDQAHIMAKGLELTADVVGPGASFHVDPAGRDVREPLGKLDTGEHDERHNGAALILTDEMEAVLAQSGDRSSRRELWTWDVLLAWLGTPQLTSKRGRSTAGPSH